MLAGWWRMTAQSKGTGKCCSHHQAKRQVYERLLQSRILTFTRACLEGKGTHCILGDLARHLDHMAISLPSCSGSPEALFFTVNLNEFQFCSLEKERMLLLDSQEVYEKNHQSLWGLEELGILSKGNLWIQYEEFPAVVIKNCKTWL